MIFSDSLKIYYKLFNINLKSPSRKKGFSKTSPKGNFHALFKNCLISSAFPRCEGGEKRQQQVFRGALNFI